MPGLARNLLTVSQMVSKGYRVLFEDNRCLINDPQGRRILDMKMMQKSFPLRWIKANTSALLASEEGVNKARFEELRRKLGVRPKLN